MRGVRLDKALVIRGLVKTRSQAEHYIKLGYVKVKGRVIIKAGEPIDNSDKIELAIKQQYVSRAALKLASVAARFQLNFKNKVVLDVGASTGGFTDFALKHGAKKVIAVDVGSGQMHPNLKTDKRVKLHEKTDIRHLSKLDSKVDIVLIDVSFISLREILPAVSTLVGPKAQIVAMAKPQFEGSAKDVNRGVVKNDTTRRRILKNFEEWAKKKFVAVDKADSAISGTKGNLERFYLLKSKT